MHSPKGLILLIFPKVVLHTFYIQIVNICWKDSISISRIFKLFHHMYKFLNQALKSLVKLSLFYPHVKHILTERNQTILSTLTIQPVLFISA